MNEIQKVIIKETDEVDVVARGLLFSLIKNMWIILLIAIISAASAYCYTSFAVSAEYKSTASLYIHDKSASSDEGGGGETLGYNTLSGTTATYLQNTYTRTLTSDSTLQIVINNLALQESYSPSQIRGMIDLSFRDYPFLDITVTSSDPQLSTAITNEIVSVISEQVSNIVVGSSITPLDKPKGPGVKSGPNIIGNTITGFLLGMFFASAIIVIAGAFNNKIKYDEYLMEKYGLSVLASITDHKASFYGKDKYYKRQGQESTKRIGGKS